MLKLPMIVRYPARVPAGRTVSALQSQVDLAPTFLAAAGANVPGYMQGFDQMPVWSGNRESVRDHIIVENRHQPTTIHLRSYVDRRYKITVYRNHDYGEIFDLEQDPHEVRNLWDEPAHAELKARLLHRFVQAEIAREPTRMPRVANA
jgi:arylsulfatase A-like enzyme